MRIKQENELVSREALREAAAIVGEGLTTQGMEGLDEGIYLPIDGDDLRNAADELDRLSDTYSFFTLMTNQLAAAWRSDWSDFDGRSLEAQMRTIRSHADQVRRGGCTIAQALRSTRVQLDLCPNRQGHWADACDDCGPESVEGAERVARELEEAGR